MYTELMSKIELLRCIHLEDIAVLVTYFQKSMEFTLFRKGFGTEFRSEKFRGIDSERFPLFRGRKHSFRGIPSSTEEPVPKLGTKRNRIPWKKLVLGNSSNES